MDWTWDATSKLRKANIKGLKCGVIKVSMLLRQDKIIFLKLKEDTPWNYYGSSK
jgi:hypothetical protein